MFSIFVCSLIDTWCIKKITVSIPGADPGFQVRGGALKKIAPSGGRRENCWGISCEKSRFYAKKSYYFQLRREARKFFGYFVWKITILHQKIIFFPILGGARSGCAPPSPPLNPPLYTMISINFLRAIWHNTGQGSFSGNFRILMVWYFRNHPDSSPLIPRSTLQIMCKM